MKFQYFYQTKDNEERSGWVKAKNRQDAFTQLRHQGIKPYKLYGNDPLPWKRWTAIGILAVLLLAVVAVLWNVERKAAAAKLANEICVRAQIYGDPAYLSVLFGGEVEKSFAHPGDRFLARHAIPGRECNDRIDDAKGLSFDFAHLKVDETKPEEFKKLTRIVNWMKDEAHRYVEAGGLAEDYALLCCERCRTELGILNQAKDVFVRLERDLSGVRKGRKVSGPHIRAEWEKQNAILRRLGLPTTPFPDDE